MSPARRGYPGRGGPDMYFAADAFWAALEAQDITPTGQWTHWHAVLWCHRNGTTDKLPEPALAQICDGLQPDWYAELVDAGIWRLEGADTGLPYYVLDLVEHTRWYPDIVTMLRDPEDDIR